MQYHCGFHGTTQTMTAPSMILSDGSSSSGSLAPGLQCQWLIDPYAFNFPTADAQSGGTGTGATSTGIQRTVVLEILKSDLIGGTLSVYEGRNTSGTLLWQCSGCSVIPRPIISKSSALVVTLTTSSTGPKGKGFRAVYWTMNQASTAWRDTDTTTNGLVLDVPPAYTQDDSKSNTSSYWHLTATPMTSNIKLSPRYTSTPSSYSNSLTDTIIDGRPAGTTFESYIDTSRHSICGIALPAGKSPAGMTTTPYLKTPTIYSAPTQYAGSYLQSTIAQKSLWNVAGSSDTTLPSSSSSLSPAYVCKYIVDSGSRYGVIVSINKFLNSASGDGNGRLRVYGGIYGNDALIYDSGWTGSANGLSLSGPCGKAMIIVETNGTKGAVNPMVNYQLDMSYQLDSNGDSCNAYSKYSISYHVCIIRLSYAVHHI